MKLRKKSTSLQHEDEECALWELVQENVEHCWTHNGRQLKIKGRLFEKAAESPATKKARSDAVSFRNSSAGETMEGKDGNWRGIVKESG